MGARPDRRRAALSLRRKLKGFSRKTSIARSLNMRFGELIETAKLYVFVKIEIQRKGAKSADVENRREPVSSDPSRKQSAVPPIFTCHQLPISLPHGS